MCPFRGGAGDDDDRPAWKQVRPWVLCGLGIAVVAQALIFQPFCVTSVGMRPNLVRGDYVAVSKFAYGWSRHSLPYSPPLFQGRVQAAEPVRGDLIVFKLPRDGQTDFASRLVGMPGDRVQIVGGKVFVNGRPFAYEALAQTPEDRRLGVHRYRETNLEGRSYVIQTRDCNNLMDNTPVYATPAGSYFFLGDNREDAIDSRFNEEAGVGFVPADNLEGRAEEILFSWTERASLIDLRSWYTEARFDRFFSALK